MSKTKLSDASGNMRRRIDANTIESHQSEMPRLLMRKSERGQAVSDKGLSPVSIQRRTQSKAQGHRGKCRLTEQIQGEKHLNEVFTD